MLWRAPFTILIILLCAAALVLLLFRLPMRKAGVYGGRRKKLKLPPRLLRLLRRVLMSRQVRPDIRFLSEHALALTENIAKLHQNLRSLPPLPYLQDGSPRLMTAAQAAFSTGTITGENLVQALTDWEAGPPTPDEAAAFPYCVAVIACQHLAALLQRMLKDSNTATENELANADELRRILEALSALARLNWQPWLLRCDPLHASLMDDPACIYPRLSPESQHALRHQVEALACQMFVHPLRLVQTALSLSLSAAPDAPERSLCHWFLTPQGMAELHRQFSTRRGWLYAHLSLKRSMLRYALLWGLSILSGAAYLQADLPVLLLPCFVLVCRQTWHKLADKLLLSPLPRLSAAPEQLRTIVVLPCMLVDSHQAISMVRRLKSLASTFPSTGVDFMLLGDFAPCMTGMSSTDSEIIQAAASAIAALEDTRFHYLQRGRTWSADHFAYIARGGRQTAVHELCRLIAQGEFTDLIACANFEPAAMERRYDYVLVLGENDRPHPGMLETLLAAAAYPYSNRFPLPGGWQGYSIFVPQDSSIYDGTGLLRPDACVESVGSFADSGSLPLNVYSELAGWIPVEGARTNRMTTPLTWNAYFERCLQTWQQLRWLLPYLNDPNGTLQRNPLTFEARFRLRERLRLALLPSAELLLLVFALVANHLPLLLLTLISTLLEHPPKKRLQLIQWVCRLSLLPTRAVTSLAAAVASFRRHAKEPVFASLEMWSQGIAAVLMLALVLGMGHMLLLGFMLSMLFACFPLAHSFYNAPLPQAPALKEESLAALEQIARSTWQYFDTQSFALPPASVQYQPALGPEAYTTPHALGATLLACLCAKELSLLNAREAASRIRETTDTLLRLPLPFGLPCRKYALPSLSVLDAGSDASSTGFLLCAVMTSAQALRCWLPDLSPEYESLSAELSSFAAGIQISSLYDPASGFLHRTVDADGQPSGFVTHAADEALLLYAAGIASVMLPSTALEKLRHTRMSIDSRCIPLSQTGTAEDLLLPGLFLPVADTYAEALLHTFQRRSEQGMWGQGKSCFYDFDRGLRLRRGCFGISAAALAPVSDHPVFAPYAAAMMLPYFPAQSAEALESYTRHGILSPCGFGEAVDFSQHGAPAGMHDAFHQCLILMSLTELMADASVRQYFCSLPEVEAFLPLLQAQIPTITLHALPQISRKPEAAPPPVRYPDPYADPPAHIVLGNDNYTVIADARGCLMITDTDIPLTQFDKNDLFGPQFYLTDEGRTYRFFDPLLKGSTSFTPGEIRWEAMCGSMKAELVCMVDTLRKRTIHVILLTNLSTLDRRIDISDCLKPDLNSKPEFMLPWQTGFNRLALHARDQNLTLHHTMDTSLPPEQISCCTDANIFLGGRSLHHPASLEHPSRSFISFSPAPCLSFRATLLIGGRSQATLWFTTSLLDTPSPSLTELSGLRRLAALQHAHDEGLSVLDESAYSLPIPETNWKHPLPSRLPDLSLSHPGTYGGFDPENGDYIVCLPPGLHLPAPWSNKHVGFQYTETVDEYGIRTPIRESVWLRAEDQVLLTPWSDTLPRCYRIGHHMTTWECWTDQLDIKLCAVALPDSPCGLRTLRIRNAGNSPCTIQAAVTARLRESIISAGDVCSVSSEDGFLLADSSWHVRRIRHDPTLSAIPCFDQLDTPSGETVLMEIRLELPPSGSASASWLSGQGLHAQTCQPVLDVLKQAGASALLRQAQDVHLQPLGRLTFDTPDEMLNMLLNHVLPRQIFMQNGIDILPGLAILDPERARALLLQHLQENGTDTFDLSCIFICGAYIHVTGDPTVLDTPVEGQTLAALLRKSLLSLPLDRDDLPASDDPVLNCMQYALAARILNASAPDEETERLYRKLQLAAEKYIWQNDHYGTPLRAEVQAFACFAFGSTTHTRQALRTAWAACYDPVHQILRKQDAAEGPLLPGLPGNGGMDALCAVQFLRALFITQHTNEGFTLLQALNPICRSQYRTRTGMNMPPYKLFGGLCAPPLEPGYALSSGDAAAAALYAVIVYDLLGFRLEKGCLSLRPRLPDDWHRLSLTLRFGASTWHISTDRWQPHTTLDGEEIKDDHVLLTDDGKVHQLRFPAG